MQVAQKENESENELDNADITMKEYKLLKKQLDNLTSEIQHLRKKLGKWLNVHAKNFNLCDTYMFYVFVDKTFHPFN